MFWLKIDLLRFKGLLTTAFKNCTSKTDQLKLEKWPKRLIRTTILFKYQVKAMHA